MFIAQTMLLFMRISISVWETSHFLVLAIMLTSYRDVTL